MDKVKNIRGIDDLKQDPRNANLGTRRGKEMLEHSLSQYGAGRSIVVDKGGVILVGNKTTKVAEELGIPIRVVQTDGKELVVVQRTDLDLMSDDDRARLMGGEKAMLCASDPPYNVGIKYGEGTDDEKAEPEYQSFSAAWFFEWQAVSDRQIVTPGCNNLARWCRYFDPYHVAPWTKTNSMTNGKVARWWCWEPVLFYGEGWKRTRPNDVFDFPIGEQGGVANHPCPKPLKMWVDFIENYTDQGDIVADAFLGAGTTLVACEQTGRIGRGMEICEKYVSVTLERLTGLGLDARVVEGYLAE